MANWYTYNVPAYEEELDDIEKEQEREYREEQELERQLDEYDMWLFDEKMKFYEELAQIPYFLKFAYKLPSRHVEQDWCEPDFECVDPMGLFYELLDRKTFRILRKKIFRMRYTPYVATGKHRLSKKLLLLLLSFARRWCQIHVLYYEDRDYNYKITLWVASRILFFLDI